MELQSHFQRNRKNRKRTESVGVVSCWPIMLFRPVCRIHHPQDPQDLPGQRLASRWASCHITQRPSRLVSFLFFVFSSCIIWVEAILKVVSSNLNCLFNFVTLKSTKSTGCYVCCSNPSFHHLLCFPTPPVLCPPPVPPVPPASAEEPKEPWALQALWPQWVNSLWPRRIWKHLLNP